MQIEATELACRLLNLYFEQRRGTFLCDDQQARKRKSAKPLVGPAGVIFHSAHVLRRVHRRAQARIDQATSMRW
jgi:hypothetical protein